MSDDSLRARIGAYLAARNVLVLSTAGPKGPWAAPVFFAADGLQLYFVSDPTSRHGSDIGKGARIAGAVTEDHRDWTRIEGLQLTGPCQPVPDLEKHTAMAVFLEKFPFAAAFLDPTGPLYEKAGRKVRFYCLSASEIWVTDNARGFGKREHYSSEQST